MYCDYNEIPHEGIRSLTPYAPGKSAEALALERDIKTIVKLGSNENPLGCSSLVTDLLAKLSTHKIATYPIASLHPLKQKLANKLAIDNTMLTLSNGSDSLFGLLLTCFGLHNKKHIITHDYAFSSYAIQAKTLGIPVISTGLKSNWDVDITAMINACNQDTALIFISNPNNPTGLAIHPDEIKRLLENIPASTLLVLDEAYYEYIDTLYQSYAIDLLKTHQNLIITRTFSKAYGLASLRLGYAISNEIITNLIHRIQLPFAVNIAALSAGFIALDDEDFITKTVELNKSEYTIVRRGLEELNLENLPSACNFITFNCNQDAMPIYQALQDYGIIVRPLHPYALNNYIRVTIGTPTQNQYFLEKLGLVIKKHNTGVNT